MSEPDQMDSEISMVKRSSGNLRIEVDSSDIDDDGIPDYADIKVFEKTSGKVVTSARVVLLASDDSAVTLVPEKQVVDEGS